MLTSTLASAIVAFAGALTVARADDACGGPQYTLEGYGAGTTGGSGPETVVKTCDEFREAANKGGIIKISGWIKKCGIIDILSDTTVIGEDSLSGLNDVGLSLVNVNNVILRNIAFQHSPRGTNNILVDGATNVWIDHNDFQASGTAAPEGWFGNQLLIKPNSDLVTVSWNSFMGHWGGAEVAEQDSEEQKRSSGIRITFHHNLWLFVERRVPALHSGVAHIYSNCVDSVRDSGITLQDGATALIENNNFIVVNQAITTNDSSATERNNIYYDSPISITRKGHVEPPYDYTLSDASCICDLLYAEAGRTLPRQ